MPSRVCATTLLLPSAIITSHFCAFQLSSRSQLVKVHARFILRHGQRHVVPLQQPKHRFSSRPHSGIRTVPAHWPHGRHMGQVRRACFNFSCVTAAAATWLFASWTISVMAAYLDILWSRRTATLTTTLLTTRRSVLVSKQAASCAKYFGLSSLPTTRTSAAVSSSSTSWKLLLPLARS